MKTSLYNALALAAMLACATSAVAQTATDLAIDPSAIPVSPETLALARTLAAKTNTGDFIMQCGLGFPIGRLLGQMHLGGPEQSKAVVQEVIRPTLLQHSAELTEIRAKTYAAILTPDDLKAAIAFYSTPAGQHLVAINAPLLQMNLAAVTQLFDTLKPEIEPKVKDTLKAHGWTN